jgi:hypothetical protein
MPRTPPLAAGSRSVASTSCCCTACRSTRTTTASWSTSWRRTPQGGTTAQSQPCSAGGQAAAARDGIQGGAEGKLNACLGRLLPLKLVVSLLCSMWCLLRAKANGPVSQSAMRPCSINPDHSTWLLPLPLQVRGSAAGAHRWQLACQEDAQGRQRHLHVLLGKQAGGAVWGCAADWWPQPVADRMLWW